MGRPGGGVVVYIVTNGDYDSSWIEGVFSAEDTAQKLIERAGWPEATIEIWVVDEPGEEEYHETTQGNKG